MLTIEPLPASSIWRPRARQHQKRPSRLTAMWRGQCSSLVSSARTLLLAMPALLTRMVTGPWSRLSWSATRSTSAESVTSRRTPSIARPWPLSSALALSRRSGRMSPTTTLAPASASAWAQARPMPWPPPVTRARRPLSSYFSRYIGGPSSARFSRHGGAGPVGQRVAVGALDGEALGVEQVAGDRVKADRDAVVDARRDLAVGLDDDHVAAGDLGVEEGLAAQALDHHDLAREVAGVGGAQVLGADAECDGVAGLDAPGLDRDRDRAAAGELDGGARLVGGGHGNRQEVHLGRADEAGDEQVARVVVELERGAGLLDHAGLEHHDLVGQRHRLDLVVGDVDHGGGQLLVEPGELDPHLDAQRRVQVRERLVEEEDLGLADDGAADGDALALAAREVLGLAGEQRPEVQDAGGLVDLGAAFGLRHAGEAQGEAHVVGHGHVRVEGVGLEDHGEAAVRRRHVVDPLAFEHEVAAGDLLEAGDHAQQGGLAAA